MTRRGKAEGSLRRRKDGRWEARLTLPPADGSRSRRSLFATTRAEAARKLREAQRAVERGESLPPERLTVAAFLDTWLHEAAAPGLRPQTLVSYSMIVERHLKPALGGAALVRLTPERLQGYMNAKRAEGLSARTIQYHHAVLRRALTIAERWGKVSRNVAKLVSPPKVERPEVRPLSVEQARVLLAAVAEDRLAAIYSTSISLGLRQGELLGLRWDDLDLDAGTLTVSRTLQRYGGEYHLDSPKTARSRRTVGVSAGLVAQLREHRARQLAERLRAGPVWEGDAWNLVFCSELGTPLSGTELTRQFQAKLAALGLPRQRWHDLRHAAATFMLAQGVDLRVVMEALGHSQIHVTANTYAHVRADATRLAAEQVDALLAAR